MIPAAISIAGILVGAAWVAHPSPCKLLLVYGIAWALVGMWVGWMLP